MSPATAYRAALAAQHPEQHAPGECPCKDGHSLPQWNGPERMDGSCARCGIDFSDARWQTGRGRWEDQPWRTGCGDCDPRLAPDAPLPAEVQAAVAAMARACHNAARDSVRLYTDAMGRCEASWAADRVAVAVERAARECGIKIEEEARR